VIPLDKTHYPAVLLPRRLCKRETVIQLEQQPEWKERRPRMDATALTTYGRRYASGPRRPPSGQQRMAETISASFDGDCEPGNPGGYMGLGWVIDGHPYHECIPAACQNTSNVAEYLALSKVLEYAIQAGATTLMVTGDSLLIIYQLNGVFAVQSWSLEPYYLVARKLLNRLRTSGCVVTLMWVPCEQNTDADNASHDALTEHGIEPARRIPGGQLDSGSWQSSLAGPPPR
jgi:ribonuclease HI